MKNTVCLTESKVWTCKSSGCSSLDPLVAERAEDSREVSRRAHKPTRTPECEAIRSFWIVFFRQDGELEA